MKRRIYPPFRQQGSALLEALIAILIFSMGILALVGLQAASVKLSSGAQYRTEASLLANQLIGQMWVSDRTPPTLQTNFQGGEGIDGASYTAWAANVAAALPGVSGVAANQPTVKIEPAANTSRLVTIRLFWKLPDEAGSTGTLCDVTKPSAAHCFIAMAQII